MSNETNETNETNSAAPGNTTPTGPGYTATTAPGYAQAAPGYIAPGDPSYPAPGATPNQGQSAFATQAAFERSTSVLDHVLSIFFGILSALVFFFTQRDRGPFVKHHVTEQLNFRLSIILYQIIPAVVFTIGIILLAVNQDNGAYDRGTYWTASTPFWSGYFNSPPTGAALAGLLMTLISCGVLLVFWILEIIFGIKLAVRAHRGEFYRVPLAIRFIKV